MCLINISGGSDGGNSNDDDGTKKLDSASTISDPEFWNAIEEVGESEEELQPAEVPNTSPSFLDKSEKI